jgi:4-hydroxy-2-oxoheptanedioate aldolase
MRENVTLRRLRAGQPAYGLSCQLAAPALVEIAGLVGFHFVMLDCEHGALGLETLEHLMRAAELTGITPVVRVSRNEPDLILRCLDAGAHGIQVPNVNSAADAQKAVRAVRYHPLGRRGMAMMRPADYGLTVSWPDYVRAANERTMLVVHVETMEAVENLDAMLAVDGVDVYFVGPADLSQSLGLPGELDHPRVVETVRHTITRIRAAGRVAGAYAPDAESALASRELGAPYLLGSLNRLLAGALRDYLRVAGR